MTTELFGLARSLILAAALALPAPATAQDVTCNADGTDNEILACADDEARLADEALNDAYREARAYLKDRDADIDEAERGEASLVAAQRAWIAYRDAQCATEGTEARGGTLQPVIELQCQARMSLARAEELAIMSTPE